MRLIFTNLLVMLFIASTFPQNYVWELKLSVSSIGGPIDVELLNTYNVYYGSDNKVYKSWFFTT